MSVAAGPEAAVRSHFVSDGHPIHYAVWGPPGPSVVLVHGWGSNLSHSWEAGGWVPALLPHRRVIALDVLGHGSSAKPHRRGAYGYAAMSRDVVNLMDHLGVERADLLGYSMGAFIGEALLLSHPARFTSMILAGIGDESAGVEHDVEVIAAALRAPDPAAIADPLGRAYRAFVDSVGGHDLEALALSAVQMWPESFPLALAERIRPGGLAEVRIPVLVVDGADDPYAATVPALTAAIPTAHLVTLPGADHLTAMSDQAFVEAVVGFLTRGNPP